ncbi:MAG: peptidoglycan-binding domain-containing protein [Hyphomicrobium sp.]
MPIASNSEIKAAQQHLQYMGYDVRDISGTLDLKTKIAIMQFQDSIGQPSTGVMTVKQLQTLFLKVAEKTAASK